MTEFIQDRGVVPSFIVHTGHTPKGSILSTVGHLSQERPFSCVLDEAHFWNAIRYVEQNPVRAGIVPKAADYRWSSAPAYCHGEFDPLIDADPKWTYSIPDWTKWLNGDSDGVAD